MLYFFLHYIYLTAIVTNYFHLHKIQREINKTVDYKNLGKLQKVYYVPFHYFKGGLAWGVLIANLSFKELMVHRKLHTTNMLIGRIGR